MNRKQLLILVVLGIVVGAFGLMLSKRNAASWNRNEGGIGQKLLGDFPINDITHIVIKHTNSELNLIKEDVWKVKERHNYPASFSEVGDFLRKAAELKAVQTVKVGPSQLGRLELLAPDKDKGTNTGTLVDFKGKDDKTIKTLLLGKKYVRESPHDSPYGGGGYPVGRYVMVPGNVQTVSVVSEALTDIEPNAEHWLNKDWFKVEKLKSIAVTSTNATNHWKVARESETGAWTLADKKEGEPVETNKLSSVGYALSSPSFTDVLSPETKLEPIVTATLETFDNFIYTVRLGSKSTNEDNYPLNVSVAATLVKERTPENDEKPEDKEKKDKEFKEKVQKLEDKLKQEQSYEKWTYVVSKWTIDPLLKERKEFL
ncbi:MAG: DUF4340 domain-containing protein, partial [Verrucomicrobiales bacterium]|nr:DUF4340 domain-containing protein [Verrucomicrobiales bacterium]